MYASPSRASPVRRGPAEGPILEFTTVIENSKADEWQKRSAALEKLVRSIPSGSHYAESPGRWYNTPTTLRHLARPVSELLKDARSTVVKRTCQYMTELFNKCQTDSRYLLKDMMPTILSVHAQTVQIIRQSVQAMVLEAITEVPCKMVMPLWMERLKIDKSRTVRDACAIYLGQALKSWTDEGYLTEEIWIQVGGTFLKSLRDPSVNVRTHARNALEHMRNYQPHYWDKLVDDPNGVVVKDPKLQRWLKSLGRGTDADAAEELSVASRFSYNSDTRFATKSTSMRMPSPRRSSADSIPQTIENQQPMEVSVPMSIQVTTSNSSTSSASTGRSSRRLGGGLGPPVRPRAPFPQAHESPRREQQQDLGPGTPPRPPSRASVESNYNNTNKGPLEPIQDNSESQLQTEVVESQADQSFPADLNAAFQAPTPLPTPTRPATSAGTSNGAKRSDLTVEVPEPERELEKEAEGPFIASTQELKEHASKRRSRSSMLMQERFRMSSGGLLSGSEHSEEERKIAVSGKPSEEENEVPNGDNSKIIDLTKVPTVQPPEHMVIAIRLLRAHKVHVDHIMETLRIEMDALRDFDRLLEEPGRPTQEEVLTYFESVGLCLDQRTNAGSQLQAEMDRISRGEAAQD